jgi:hypothetical protein
MSASDREQSAQSGRLGDNQGPPMEDPGPAQDYQLVGPLALHSDAVDPEELAQFLAAIRSQGNNPGRQAAISNTLRRARADPNISHMQYRLLEQTASRTRQPGRYNYEPQEVRAFFSSLTTGANVNRAEGPMVLKGYMRTIRFARKSGGRPMVFSTIQCSAADRTGESHSELMGRARQRFNGEDRAERAGYNWSADTDVDAYPACELAIHHGDALRGGQSIMVMDCQREIGGSIHHGDGLTGGAIHHGDELIVNNTTTPEGGLQNGADTPLQARAEVPTDQQIEEFRSLCDTFGRRPGAMVIQKTPRDAIEADLRTAVRPFVEQHGIQIAGQALDRTIVLARQGNKPSKGEGGAPSLFRFLFQVLPDQAANVERAEKSRADKQQADQAVQAEIAGKRMATVRSTPPRQPMRVFKR